MRMFEFECFNFLMAQKCAERYSWFEINLSGCGGQCQPLTPGGSNIGINKIFLCVVPPTWPP